jgi:hypothetical protein
MIRKKKKKTSYIGGPIYQLVIKILLSLFFLKKINFYFLEIYYHYFSFESLMIIHYQKINKYKQKYRGNISVGKFSRDFIDGNIPSVYIKGITVGKKIKTKQKKMMTCYFFRRNLFRR